jgi:hypothetical protein
MRHDANAAKQFVRSKSGIERSDQPARRTQLQSNQRSARSTTRMQSTTAGFRNEGAGITFSSHGRHSAASSAAQKSTAGALSHTSQIVRIPPSRARGHRSPSIPSTTPPLSRSASTPAVSQLGGAGGGRCGLARGGANKQRRRQQKQRPQEFLDEERCGSDAARRRGHGRSYYLIWMWWGDERT